MAKPFILLAIILIASVSANSPMAKCPNNDALQVVQDTIKITSGGDVSLEKGKDIQCYNYTLAKPFKSTPCVAIAACDFDSDFNQHLFFSIKAVNSDSNGVIPFIVRTQWGYTRWNKIIFNFIAQTSNQIEAGYYQVDTASLSNCYRGKNIIAFLPFTREMTKSGFKAMTFLNGFEISSVSVNNSYSSPFELSILKQKVSHQGISLIIQSTAETQIHSLFISYLAYDINIQNLVAGTYTYDQYLPSSSLEIVPPIGITNNNVAFHGFNSFIVRNINNRFTLAVKLDSTISITSANSIYYLTYNYFVLIGGPCGQCVGHHIDYKGDCVAHCPPGSYYNGKTCIECLAGQIWNGNQCVDQCGPTGRLWNAAANSCVCPNNLNWDGSQCVACNGQGRVWNTLNKQCTCVNGGNWNGFVCINCAPGLIFSSNSLTCVCPTGTFWTGSSCVACPGGQVWIGGNCQCPAGSNWSGSSCVTCNNGQVWVASMNRCSCPSGTVLIGGGCQSIPTCTNGKVLNSQTNTCQCEQSANWNGANCITCSNGQIWNSQSLQCICPQGFNWNGYSCINCQNGQAWDSTIMQCTCPKNQNWNGFQCKSCSGGRTWNAALNDCSCSPGQNWNGAACISCPQGSNWNGVSCITCSSGMIWISNLNICQCPSGQQWNGSNCIIPCPEGMISNNGVCICPAGKYNLNGKCVILPSCQSGFTWNGLQCVPIQCPPGTFWNGTLCISNSQVTCPSGTKFDGTMCVTDITTCPAGTKWKAGKCQSITNCAEGSFMQNGRCVPISSLCPSGLEWKNNQCVPITNNCPDGTYYNGAQCIPFRPCNGGKKWNATVTQCVCPTGTFWNGNICIQCNGGKTFMANKGCFCPKGTFHDGSKCTPVQANQCASVPYSMWNGHACVCHPGFSVMGMNCVCEGLKVSEKYCDRCYNKPHSKFINGICQCNTGYHDIQGKCEKTTPGGNGGNGGVTPICNVATYWDNQQKQCLPCASGCLSCTSCYSCTSCSPGFYLDFNSGLCLEVCGDNKRYTLECDDGNNVNGDGCSSDCKVEVGFNCYGGSPSSKDSCTKTIPQALSFTSSGQSHLYGKIVLNVKANYLPLSLIRSATDCKNQCNNILAVNIISGFKGATSIKAQYIPSTSFSFSIQIMFGRQPIGPFSVQIGIKQGLVQKYFSGVDTSSKLRVDVNPAFLAKVHVDEELV